MRGAAQTKLLLFQKHVLGSTNVVSSNSAQARCARYNSM